MGDVIKEDPNKNVFILDDAEDAFEYETVEVVEQYAEPSSPEASELAAEKIPDVDPKDRDLLWALTKPLGEMTDAELMVARGKIRELRTVRVGTQKKKSSLDLILAQLTAEQSAAILKQLEALEAAKTAAATPVEDPNISK